MTTTGGTDPRIRYIQEHLAHLDECEHNLARTAAAISDLAERYGTDAQKLDAGRLVGIYMRSGGVVDDFRRAGKDLTDSLEHTLILTRATLPQSRDLLSAREVIRKTLPDVEAALVTMARGMGGAEVVAELGARDPLQPGHCNTAYRQTETSWRQAEKALRAYAEALRGLLPDPPTGHRPATLPAAPVPQSPPPGTDPEADRLPEAG